MNLDGSNQQTFASGLHSPIRLDFHPNTGELYATVNEQRWLSDDLVPDYLTRIAAGQFYGWPYAYLTTKIISIHVRCKTARVNALTKQPNAQT